MKQIGTWSRSNGNILINIPKMRKVGNKKYPIKSKYLGEIEYPFPAIEVEQDLKAEYGLNVKLVATSIRGGKVMTD